VLGIVIITVDGTLDGTWLGTTITKEGCDGTG
jgi:hypothetical protein